MLAVDILAAVLVLGVLGWLLLRNRLARRLLTDAHLVEVALGLEKVKRAALSRPIESAAAFAPLPRDPRILATSVGLLLFYTVSPFEGQSAHHLSLSVSGGYLPRAAGETLLVYLAGLLGIACNRLSLYVSPTSVQHAEFLLDSGELAELANRPIKPPAADRLPALRKEWSLVRETLRWERIDMGRTKTR
jgi:hypothetical protein